MVNLFFPLKKYLSPVLKALKGPSASIEDYTAEFGSLGSMLHTAVGRERKSSGNQGNQLAKIAAGTPTQERSRPTVTIPTVNIQFKEIKPVKVINLTSHCSLHFHLQLFIKFFFFSWYMKTKCILRKWHKEKKINEKWISAASAHALRLIHVVTMNWYIYLCIRLLQNKP